MKRQDVAKFVSGAACVELLNHVVLAKGDLLPLHFFGITVSRSMNLVILAAWAVALVWSVYYGWVKKN